MLPRISLCIPAETNRVVQVKYTNLRTIQSTSDGSGKYAFGSEKGSHLVTSCAIAIDASLSFSGSNQAREGRLVNALAVRGDERRDTLR